MLFEFMKPGDWFAPKQFGYGAGMPIAWQGWALIGTNLAFMTGAGTLAGKSSSEALYGILGMMVLATILLVIIARKRTRGAWRWRWGENG